MVEPHSSNFRVITTMFLGVRKLRIITVVDAMVQAQRQMFRLKTRSAGMGQEKWGGGRGERERGERDERKGGGKWEEGERTFHYSVLSSASQSQRLD